MLPSSALINIDINPVWTYISIYDYLISKTLHIEDKLLSDPHNLLSDGTT